MITVYDKPVAGTGLSRQAGAAAIGERTVWIDLLDPTPEEDAAVEARIGISVPTRAEMREIESSSRLYSENGTSYMTAFIVDQLGGPHAESTTVTFILSGNRLVSLRYSEPKAFQIYLARADKGATPCGNGAEVLVGVIEALISRTADLVEQIQDEVEKLTSQLFHIKGGKQTRDRRLDVLLKSTGREGDLVASAQESAMSLERLLNFFRDHVRRHGADSAVDARIVAALTDLTSLDDHMGFLADRTSFLLQATLGMINIEQNQVIKLFSVMAVMLMPPTLVASIYGMNFKHMPELEWHSGYPWALGLMLLSALIPFLYFKRKGWL